MAQVGQKSETWKQKRANMRASVSMRVRVRACACASACACGGNAGLCVCTMNAISDAFPPLPNPKIPRERAATRRHERETEHQPRFDGLSRLAPRCSVLHVCVRHRRVPAGATGRRDCPAVPAGATGRHDCPAERQIGGSPCHETARLQIQDARAAAARPAGCAGRGRTLHLQGRPIAHAQARGAFRRVHRGLLRRTAEEGREHSQGQGGSQRRGRCKARDRWTYNPNHGQVSVDLLCQP